MASGKSVAAVNEDGLKR